MKVYIMNAFTDGLKGGNPAGVAYLADSEELSEEEMQKIAAELDFSETVFISRKKRGGIFRPVFYTGMRGAAVWTCDYRRLFLAAPKRRDRRWNLAVAGGRRGA